MNPLLIPNIESNIQYEKLKLLTEDKYVFYDRLNTTTSLYFTDVLTQIFKEAYFEGKAFYNYFIPSSIYDNISKPSRDLIETKEIDDRLFDEETISLLLSWDLVNINKGQIRVTEKFKSFL